MSSLNYLVPQRKREHPNRKKSKAKAARCAQAAHGYKASPSLCLGAGMLAACIMQMAAGSITRAGHCGRMLKPCLCLSKVQRVHCRSLMPAVLIAC